MNKLFAALVTSVLAIACDRPAPAPVHPEPARLQVTLGARTTTLGALRPIEQRLPFCEAGQVFEARNETAALRVCVSSEDGPVAAHVAFYPSGRPRLDPGRTWYSGLLEPGTVELTRAPDGTRVAQVDGAAMLAIRVGVASFLNTLEPAEVVLSGEARLQG